MPTGVGKLPGSKGDWPSSAELGLRGSAPAARHHSTTISGRQRQQASGQWTASKLVVTPHSLGAVTVGMTLAQASAVAGVQIVEVGDGFGYPSGKSSTGLAIAGPPQDPARCVIADAAPAGPNVVTPKGFLLGGTVQALKSLYGSRLRFVPAPASGYNAEPGYVATFPDGNLAFIARNGTVTAIIGGKNAMPSTC